MCTCFHTLLIIVSSSSNIKFVNKNFNMDTVSSKPSYSFPVCEVSIGKNWGIFSHQDECSCFRCFSHTAEPNANTIWVLTMYSFDPIFRKLISKKSWVMLSTWSQCLGKLKIWNKLNEHIVWTRIFNWSVGIAFVTAFRGQRFRQLPRAVLLMNYKRKV